MLISLYGVYPLVALQKRKQHDNNEVEMMVWKLIGSQLNLQVRE